MSAYLLQIPASDFELQLKTEVIEETIGKLQAKAKAMVKKNPEVKGMEYRIFKIVKKELGGFDSIMVKNGTIEA